MVCIGVLALQGSFQEHIEVLKRIGATAMDVRTTEQLSQCDGLIIPGGESTTMAHIANNTGMLDALKEFVITQKKPVWGTCAGLIFLAESAEGAKSGGQALLQCMPLHVSRNFFGAQIASFEQRLPVHKSLSDFGGDATYRAVFIRAPAILKVDESKVTVLSRYILTDNDRERSGREDVIVAARCMHMLATAFHPELTDDDRWHRLFLSMVPEQQRDTQVGSGKAELVTPGSLPAPLPVYGTVHPCA